MNEKFGHHKEEDNKKSAVERLWKGTPKGAEE